MNFSIRNMLNQLFFMGYCHYISYWEKKSDLKNNAETRDIYEKSALKDAVILPAITILIPAHLLTIFLFLIYVENGKFLLMIFLLGLMAIIFFIFRKKYVTDGYTKITLKRYENTSKQNRRKFKRKALFFYVIMFALFISMLLTGSILISVLNR